METSPAKRRALAPLDANASSPVTGKQSFTHLKAPLPYGAWSPSSKRGLDAAAQTLQDAPPNKRACTPASSSRGEQPPDDSTIYTEDRANADDQAKFATVIKQMIPQSRETTRTEREPSPYSPSPSSTSGDAEAEAEESSLFDTSAPDVSQATTALTEPSPSRLVASTMTTRLRRRQTVLTREQARQRAEILRLRLGLAGYKLRTGQEDVPFRSLVARRVRGPADERGLGEEEPRLPVVVSASPGAGNDAEEEEEEEGEGRADGRRRGDAPRRTLPGLASFSSSQQLRHPLAVSHARASPEKSALPRLPHASIETPTRARFDDEDRLTSSAIRGGAAKGLLSLSRG